MVDSVSASLSISPKVSVIRYITQSVFLFVLAVIAAFAIILKYGNLELWTMVLILCISQVLNLPIVDIVEMIKETQQQNV